ncbi:MAG: ribonuclease P protein component [Planctomycetota bacterium]
MVSDDERGRTLRFPREARLLRSSEFDAVFAAKLSAGDGVLVMHTRPNQLDHPRLGLVVSRKVGKAVFRNRWKRVLRAAFRLSQHELPAWDIVCLPRSRETPTLAAIAKSLDRLVGRVEAKAARRAAATKPVVPEPATDGDSDAG